MFPSWASNISGTLNPKSAPSTTWHAIRTASCLPTNLFANSASDEASVLMYVTSVCSVGNFGMGVDGGCAINVVGVAVGSVVDVGVVCLGARGVAAKLEIGMLA